MQYKKYQQLSSPRAEHPRTSQPIRPCIKYVQPADATVTVPQRRHQLLSEMEPALMDEQPLTDVDPLPALSEHEPYFDSLEEYDSYCREDDQQTTTDAADEQPSVSDYEQTSVDDKLTGEHMDVPLVPDVEAEPVTTTAATDQVISELAEPAADAAEPVTAAATDVDDVPQQHASAEVRAVAVYSSM